MANTNRTDAQNGILILRSAIFALWETAPTVNDPATEEAIAHMTRAIWTLKTEQRQQGIRRSANGPSFYL